MAAAPSRCPERATEVRGSTAPPRRCAEGLGRAGSGGVGGPPVRHQRRTARQQAGADAQEPAARGAFRT